MPASSVCATAEEGSRKQATKSAAVRKTKKEPQGSRRRLGMDTVKSPFARVCLRAHSNVSMVLKKYDRPVSSSAAKGDSVDCADRRTGIYRLSARWDCCQAVRG